MLDVKQLVENFQDFRGDLNLYSVVGGLLLEIAKGNTSLTNGGTTENNITWANPVNDTVTDTVADILSADPNRKALRICNLDQDNWIYLNINVDARNGQEGTVENPISPAAMYIIPPGATSLLDDESVGRISAIASAGIINITYMIGT